MFKFIHAADIHLDSPLLGLQKYQGAPVEEIRGATRQALKALVELALAEEVAFVLIAGDLYDRDWKDYNTGLFFTAQMSRLRETAIQVFLISGNHDAASHMTKHLRLPDNVFRPSHHAPESRILEDLGVVVHGQGFYTKAVTENLAVKFPPRRSDLFNIGLLHTSANGRPGHETYAPCTLEDLLAKGYDYWALGHVHQREVLHQDPWVVYPGNIQGRHIREPGPKGCTLVTVDDGKVTAIDHHDLDVLRWARCEVDATGTENPQEVLDLVSKNLQAETAKWIDCPLAIRLTVHGSCGAHLGLSMQPEHWINEIRALTTDLSSGNIWLEKILFETTTKVNLEEMLARQDAIGGLLRGIQDLSVNDRLLDDLQGEFDELQRKLPPEMKFGDEAVNLDDHETYRQVMEDVKHLLMAHLLKRGTGQ
jgi:DNA repair exonuclease SbcCD nuclease subunit